MITVASNAYVGLLFGNDDIAPMVAPAEKGGYAHYMLKEIHEQPRAVQDTYNSIVKDGKVFEAGEVKIWKCRNCGHIVVGTKAPEVCPVCNHPKAYFEIKAENY